MTTIANLPVAVQTLLTHTADELAKKQALSSDKDK
jgi:hypothetical protein